MIALVLGVLVIVLSVALLLAIMVGREDLYQYRAMRKRYLDEQTRRVTRYPGDHGPTELRP